MTGIGLFLFSALVLGILCSTFYSLGRILYRLGFSPAWILLAGLWPILIPVLAHVRWPIEDRTQR